MPQNLEVKIQLKSFKKVIKILQNLNAEFAGELVQKDIYYKVKKDLLKLRIENGNESLIKYNREEKRKDRWSDYEILYFSAEKSDSKNSAEKFFAGIFEIEIFVKKVRKLYLYKNTRIHLDYVDKLGYFLELETRVLNGKKDAEKRFNFLVKKLEIDLTKQIRKSYRDLMMENVSSKIKIFKKMQQSIKSGN